MRVAILGAGATGSAAAVELTRLGHRVRLWNRSPESLAPLQALGGISHEGALGSGVAHPEAIGGPLAKAVGGADVVLVCLPATAHAELGCALAELRPVPPVVLSPGHLCGALDFAHRFGSSEIPPIAELSTAPYVARRSNGRVLITAKARRIRGAAFGASSAALDAARELFQAVEPQADVLATGLTNVNLVLHPPAAILAAAWIEATAGDFRFYSDGSTEGVIRAMQKLDRERLAVARAYGHALPPLLDEMAAIGSVDVALVGRGDWRKAIAESNANVSIRAPDSLQHRYYREDFGFGLLPLVGLARLASVEVPVANALLELARVVVDEDLVDRGRSIEDLGLAGLDIETAAEAIRGGASVDRRSSGR